GTVAVAEAFAQARGEPEKLIVGHFEWCDDFAAARNYADTLASGDWLLNLDLDETIDGAPALRDLAASASPDTVAFACWTAFTVPPHSERVGLRMARSGAAAWQGDLQGERMFEPRQ